MINKILSGLLVFVSTVKGWLFWALLYGFCLLALLGGLWAAYYLTTLWRW
jgi:hypothetical protein